MAKKKQKQAGFVGIINLQDWTRKSSVVFEDKGEAQKWVQREMSSDFIWVGDMYANTLHATGEVKKA